MAALERYIHTGATPGGDGESNALTDDASGHRAFSTMSEMEAAMDGVQTYSAGNELTVYCSGTAADTSGTVTFSGWTITTENGVVIRGHDSTATDQTNSGAGFNDDKSSVYSTSHYRMEEDGDIVVFAEGGLSFERLQFAIGDNASGSTHVVFDLSPSIPGGDPKINIFGNRFRRTGTTTSGFTIAVFINDLVEVAVNGNLCTGGSDTWDDFLHSLYQAGPHVAFNNTVRDCGEGIKEGSSATSAAKARNNAVFECTDDFDVDATTAWTLTHNASDDGDGTSAQTLNGTRTVDFVDPASGDYTPTDGGVLADNGIGPSSDSDVPSEDAFGTAISGDSCDIGWIQRVASGGQPTMRRWGGTPGMNYSGQAGW